MAATLEWVRVVVGPLAVNCYLVACTETGDAAVIDPGDEGERLLALLDERQWCLRTIVNTHGHFDHIGANATLKEATDADIVLHCDDSSLLDVACAQAASYGLSSIQSPPPDRFVTDGERIVIGNAYLHVLHTPGHSPGSVSLAGDGMVFVGDTLFAGSIGRTDLPGGSFPTLIGSVTSKIFPLGDEMVVLTGHGPTTTIAEERAHNQFFSQNFV